MPSDPPSREALRRRLDDAEAESARLSAELDRLRHGEVRLRESETRFRTIVTNAQAVIFILDAEGKFLLSEGRSLKLLGLEPGEVVGESALEIYRDYPRIVSGVERALAGEFTNDMVEVGDLIFDVFWSPDFDANGEVVGAMGMAIDVTDRKRAEMEVRLFRRMLDESSDLLSIVDYDSGRFIIVNDAVQSLLGFTKEEFLELSFTDVDLGLMDPDAAMRFRAELEEKRQMVFQSPTLTKDGGTFILEVNARLIRHDGKPYIVAIGRDIRERQQAEEEKRLLESQLRQTEKMQAIGQLAGGIAHDFNNQLAGILGYAEILASRLDAGELRTYAERVATGARRSADLTAQLLAFARKGQYRRVKVDVHATLEEVVSLLEHSIDKRIAIRREFAADPPFTRGDPTQLQNALLNLALNARDAMPEGGELTLATATVALDGAEHRRRSPEIPPGRYLEIVVRDTGEGMDPELQRHIFEPFFTTKGEGKGTGMGLAAVYGTVKAHLGAIEVDSAPGRGTTMRLLLPLRDDGAAPAEDEPPVLPRAERPAHILVVDDEETIRRLSGEVLRAFGHTVTLCADGAEAIARYRELWREIDLVILDMVMPRLGGRDTFHALQGINPDVKVLLSSGYALDEEMRSLLELGALDFVQKPFTMAELSRVIAEALAD